MNKFKVIETQTKSKNIHMYNNEDNLFVLNITEELKVGNKAKPTKPLLHDRLEN